MSVDTQELSALLGKERQTLQSLAMLLDREFELAQSGADSTAILSEKQALVARLDTETDGRLRWLEQRGLPTHGDELRAAIADLEGAGLLGDELRQFEAEALACRERNRQLAQFNLRRQRALQRALRLFQEPNEADSEGYGAPGQPVEPSAGRLLGSA